MYLQLRNSFLTKAWYIFTEFQVSTVEGHQYYKMANEYIPRPRLGPLSGMSVTNLTRCLDPRYGHVVV